MATRANLIRDALYFLKVDLNTNITDPIVASRKSNSKFVMTSYPQREVQYPIITIKMTNLESPRAGMQTTQMDIKMTFEIRIWGRNEKEKDELYNAVYERLANIQFTAGGSNANDFHNYRVLSSTEIDEPGDAGIKSRILQVNYSFFN